MFTQDKLDELFPKERADQFFEALYGDVADGVYDIVLKYSGCENDKIEFEFHLEQRLGKCLACNLTYGLPEVFSRHPIININGLVQDIQQTFDGQATCSDWQLGATQEVSNILHIIPLTIKILHLFK